MADREHAHTRAELLRRAAALGLGLYGVGRIGLSPWARAAQIDGPLLTTEEVALPARHLARSTSTVLAPTATPPFTLLGLHWQGPGVVSFRTRSTGGDWTPWNRATVHEGPDPGLEGSLEGWNLGTPVWTGGSDAVQYQTSATVTRLRAHYIWSAPRSTARRERRLPDAPAITLREGWGADETIVRAPPLYADQLLMAIVHHTAGASPSTPDDSAAIIRAIEVYHVKSNGWNDIGYNFLVDPFGQIFEGRAGGIDRNVVGAHALGFNTGSTGVALLGNFQKVDELDAAKQALVALLSWRLDVGHVDPASVIGFPSGGTIHQLRAVSGHRDVNSTECPGDHLYADLDEIAAAAAALGLPKLFEPAVDPLSPTGVHFTARLSEPLAWTVTVSNTQGTALATGSGQGTAVDWTWSPPAISLGTFGYTITAPGARPAAGSFSLGDGAPPPTPIPPKPERPAGVPRHVPAWAWKLRRWWLTPKPRGPRPASAPRKVPSWFWPWFRWQNELRDWKAKYGS